MLSIFKGFAKRAENEFDFKIKKIRSDNSSEFKNSKIKDYCDEKGVKHEFSDKYTPQQNGVFERKNRTLIDMARSMLSEYNVSDSFWAEAINTACHASIMPLIDLSSLLIQLSIGSSTDVRAPD
jgi:transposase InsO family protein